MILKRKFINTLISILLLNKLASQVWVVFLLILVQQLIVASSSIWLTYFLNHLHNGAFDPKTITLYAISLALPYLPGACSFVYLKKWETNCLAQFCSFYFNLWQGRIELFGKNSLKDSQSSLVSKDIPQLISETNRHIYDIISASLNVILNLIVVTYLLNIQLFFSFLVGLIVLIIGTGLTKHRNQKIAGQYEVEKSKYGVCLASVWDNLIISNKMNFENWFSRFRKIQYCYSQTATEYAVSQEAMSTSISFFGMLPTVVYILYFVFSKSNHPLDLVPFVVLFPRIFILLNTTTALVFLVRNSFGFKGRWISVLERVDPPAVELLKDRIDMTKISYEGSLSEQKDFGFQYPENFLDSISQQSYGRITIRGENGSGKSSLLCWLKARFGDYAYYLPSHHSLVFSEYGLNKSTGERIKLQLKEIFSYPDLKYILLDEWDANMDKKNISIIENWINEASKYKTIVEIRHR